LERFVALYAADNSGIPKVSAAFKYSYCADTPNSPSDLVALRKNMVRPSVNQAKKGDFEPSPLREL